MKGVRICPWGPGSRSHPRICLLRYIHTGTAFQHTCEWWRVQCLVVCTVNIGLKRRRRDNIFADHNAIPAIRA
jgi:hypothetical protein